MSDSPKKWQAIDASALNEACEAIEYGLMEAGALGTETSVDATTDVTVRGYFETKVLTLRPCALVC